MRQLDLSKSEKIPEVTSIEVIKESPDSYNLYVEIANWTFTPENTGGPTVANQGHAHVFIDGRKAGRMYGNWFHLGALKPGSHQIAITLNGNDHTDFIANDKLLGGETSITVTGE